MDGKLRNMTSIYLYDENDRFLLLYRIGSRVVKKGYVGTAGGHFEKDELNDSKGYKIKLIKADNLKQVIEELKK